MITIKATIYYEDFFWVAVFERTDKQGYAAARKIFGGEPADAEIYQFVLNNFDELQFGPAKAFELKIKRTNPKRVQRMVRKEMEEIKKTQRPSTLAQDYMREELEKKKMNKKIISKEQKETLKEQRFQLKQQKRKEKQRGH